MAAAFVDLTSGFDSYSVAVPAGTDRMLLVVAYSASARAGGSATYNGSAMSVATNANDWVKIFYMLDPPVGSANVVITHADLGESISVNYTGIDSFQASSGQVGNTASASFSPTGAGLVVFGISAGASGHAPAANCNERYDNTTEWFCDRIVASSGAVTVGATSSTTPDFAGAIFLEPASGPTLTATFEAQAASSSAAAVVGHPATAAFTAQSASSSATAVVGHPATATFAAQDASFSATATAVGTKTLTASFAAQSAAMDVALSVPAPPVFTPHSAVAVVDATARVARSRGRSSVES